VVRVALWVALALLGCVQTVRLKEATILSPLLYNVQPILYNVNLNSTSCELSRSEGSQSQNMITITIAVVSVCGVSNAVTPKNQTPENPQTEPVSYTSTKQKQKNKKVKSTEV
jgi:hypothetical protein